MTLLETLAADNTDAPHTTDLPEYSGYDDPTNDSIPDNVPAAPEDRDDDGPDWEDLAWVAEQQTGGCLDGETSPEQRLIAAGPSPLAHFLDQSGEEYEAASRYEAGYCFC